VKSGMVSALPQSELGRCTARFYLDDCIPIIAVRAHFDGSDGQDDNHNRWLTLACYIGSDGFWAEFDTAWTAMLHNRYPVAPFIHMIDLMAWDDPFERVNGWDEAKRDALIGGALRLLQGLNKKAFRSFVCSVDVTSRDRLVAEGFSVPDPIVLCSQWCFRSAFDWYIHKHDLEVGYAFYDRGEPFLATVKGIWLKERTPSKQLVKKGVFWDLIANMEEVDMAFTPGVQAADMLAWSLTRALSKADRDYRDLLEFQRIIIPQTWLEVTEEVMLIKYPKSSSGRS
jgi:hypothetical protein